MFETMGGRRMSLPTPYYQDSAVTIYHGDCREIMQHLPRADLLLTDPPYGIRYSSDYSCGSTKAELGWSQIAGDDDLSARDSVIGEFSEWAVFGSHKVAHPQGWRGVLVWDKGPASGMGDLSFPWKLSFELIFVSGCEWRGPRAEGVLKGHHVVTRACMGRVHPNEKPVSLLAAIIAKHPAQTILDPFAGSGTTGRAAKDLGRKAILIEIEERYCEIAAKRMAQEVLL